MEEKNNENRTYSEKRRISRMAKFYRCAVAVALAIAVITVTV